MEIKNTIANLRIRIEEYKYNITEENRATRREILALEIALCLTELFVYCNRKIKSHESYWFEGGHYISYDFTGKWEDIANMYDDLVDFVNNNGAYE